MNSKPISWAENECEDSSLPINNLSIQSMCVAHSSVWNHYVPLQKVHKDSGSSLSDQLYKKIKWVNGCWCVGHSFLPSLLQGHRKSVGAKESSVQRGCGCPCISTSQYLIHHTRRQREDRWLKVGWKLPGCRHAVRVGRRVCPLEQRAGALWGWWGCVRGAVTHGQYVIVAGDVAATGKVIGTLGEAGGHSIGSLQNTHRRLCDILVKEEGKSRRGMWKTLRLKSGRQRLREKEQSEVHAIQKQPTFPLIKAYKVCTGSQPATWPERP